MDLTNPFFKLISDVMTEEAAKYGYEVVSADGNNDPAVQNNQIADFIAQGYDAIFLNPADANAAGDAVKRAHEAGVPLFTFDAQIADDAAKDLVVSHIGSDNYQGGLLAAESMVAAVGNDGDIAIISHPDAVSCILRVNGFKDYLKEHNSNLNIVKELPGKGNRDESYNTATDILQAHPDIIGVFALNDPSDASPAGKQAVFEKKLFDTPQQFPRRMATGTVKAFMAYLEGETVEKVTFIPCEAYRYETAEADEARVEDQW
jgi:ribose transport system substrate-binding protein